MILLLGSAGSGKSVQAKLLSDAIAYEWVSTGVLLRATNDRRLLSSLERGEISPDETVIKLLTAELDRLTNPSAVILDGFPRSLPQVDWLIRWAEREGIDIEAVVHLVVDPNVAIQRLLDRHRSDDNEGAIRARISNMYTGVIKPTLEVLKQRHIKVLDIDANPSIESVHSELMKALGK